MSIVVLLSTRHITCLIAIAVVATGCSGINAGTSISPINFLLPALLQNSLPSPLTPMETNAVPLLALASQVPLWAPLRLTSPMNAQKSTPAENPLRSSRKKL